jgi:arabinogalactan endo-1,4-beta-galactosidase
VVSGSASLQTELENIEKIIPKYTPLAEAAQTQVDMNISSQWFFVIWDTELNNLWSRISNSADQQTKERILAEQRNWRRTGVGEMMAEKDCRTKGKRGIR